MISEIKEMLERGEVVELECIDSDSFINVDNGNYKKENEEVLSSDLRVEGIASTNRNIYISGCDYSLTSNEFQFFRIKEKAKNAVGITSHTHTGVTSGSETTAPESNPAFDDLIDVAVKAVKDRALFTMSIGNSRRKGRYLNYAVNGSSPNESFYENNGCHQSAINFINSLYTETFVIEDNHNLMKALEGASGTLANGEEFLVSNDAYSYTNKNKLLILIGGEKMHANLSILKGATVTQKKVNK